MNELINDIIFIINTFKSINFKINLFAEDRLDWS